MNNYSVTWEAREKIREAYKKWKPRTCPYSYFGWIHIFTPIENNVWADIRYLGLPMYPQFPVSKYFVDFADPVRKIAVEVDGAQWHIDKQKDKKREADLRKEGWVVYRIPGNKTFTTREDYIPDGSYFSKEENEEALERFYKESSEGILTSIYLRHYL